MTVHLLLPLAITLVVLLSDARLASAGGTALPSERTLFEFEKRDSTEGWTSVNDTVMGGLSSGGCRWIDEGTLEFAGDVSLENNGGFASVRVGTGALDLSDYDELHMRVRGDGKRYAFSVQTDHWMMAGAYYFHFQTAAGQWQEIRTPMRALEARSFGRPLRGAPALNTRDIRAFGFMISDKQAGPFRLEVDRIQAVKSRPIEAPPSEAVDQDVAESAAALMQKAISRGVPLFNAGQSEACAALYEITADALLTLAARDLPPPVVAGLREGLAAAERTSDPAARAWALRRALDTALQALTPPARDQEKGVL